MSSLIHGAAQDRQTDIAGVSPASSTGDAPHNPIRNRPIGDGFSVGGAPRTSVPSGIISGQGAIELKRTLGYTPQRQWAVLIPQHGR